MRVAPGVEQRQAHAHASAPQRLATLEAVARALGILEGPEVESALLRVIGS